MTSFRLTPTGSICCLVALAISFLPHTVSAAKLVLKDGTVIHGEIESLQNDVYTVQTGALGTLQVLQDDVKTIDLSGSAVGRPSSGKMPESVQHQAVQSKLVQDPTLLSKVEALQADPDVQAILTDPEIMSAIAAGDYAALMSNPKIKALSQNSRMREIVDAAK